MNNFSKKEELEAEIRNKLTMPLTVLNKYKEGGELSKQDIQLAINELNELLKLIEKHA